MADYAVTFAVTSGHQAGTYYYCQAMVEASGGFYAAGVVDTDPDYADTVLEATELNGSGVYGWLPPSNLPAGYYKIFFRQGTTEGSEAATDNILQSKKVRKYAGRVKEV